MDRLLAFTALIGLVVLSLVGLGAPASAGGWAVTTFDHLPPEFVADRTYHLGYTIRQHGVTPIRVDRTEVIAVTSGGASRSFPGTPDGTIGHYVVDVALPSGSYTWRVTQQPFMAQELGPLTVGDPAVLPVPGAVAPSPAAPPVPVTPIRPLAAVLAAATVLSALVFLRLLAVPRRGRGAAGAS
ncbi:MAG TPA: hypothetical protein VM070_08515 [Candidatus Saccharimonadales bacterium]|nr:hypothetical protein [Candidatus Saccharimonadales bacterium]